MASAGALDESCPNLEDHRGQHLRLEDFLYLIRVQLAGDRGADADCILLYVKGSRGALVKIRLSLHGYTFVAKAMKQVDRSHLLREASIYSKLHSLQGSRILVCLGVLHLDLLYYYDRGMYTSMLILSWAGYSLYQYLNKENQLHMLDEVSKILIACYKYRVLHKDVEPRNWLWDGQRIMLIDFERAEVRARQPLEMLNPNRKRKRLGDIKGKVHDDFSRETQSARGGLSRCIL